MGKISVSLLNNTECMMTSVSRTAGQNSATKHFYQNQDCLTFLPMPTKSCNLMGTALFSTHASIFYGPHKQMLLSSTLLTQDTLRRRRRVMGNDPRGTDDDGMCIWRFELFVTPAAFSTRFSGRTNSHFSSPKSPFYAGTVK